ncbi:phospholipase A2 [Entamoeba marina]
MNPQQQIDLLSYVINEYITKDLNTQNAVLSFTRLRQFPIQNSTLFPRLIFETCKQGIQSVLQLLCEHYPDYIELPNVRGETAIFTCVEYRHLVLVKYLISIGVRLDRALPTGDTLLHKICLLSPSPLKMECSKVLIDKHSTLILSSNVCGENPIHLAALSGDKELVEYLLTCKADPMAKTIRSCDALKYAIASGNNDTIVLLKQLCKKVDPKGTPVQRQNSLNLKTNSQIKEFSSNSNEEDDSTEGSENNSLCASEETTVHALYEKFQSYHVKQKKTTKIKTLIKKVYVSPKQFESDTIGLIKNAFISKTMLETPNNFGKGKKYRIISLDGGGIKVILELILLRRLAHEFPDMFVNTNLFCGCSASSAVATCLAMGFSLEGLINLIEHVIRYSFKKDSVQSVTNAKYVSDYLKQFASIAFSDLPLKNIPRHVVFPAFLLDSCEEPRRSSSKVFTNIVEGNDHEKVSDVCLRSAAAPTYYKPYQNYVDGGVIDNSPVGVAWPYLIGENGIGIDPKDIVCLSISGGKQSPSYIDTQKIGNGGLVQWATNISDCFMLARRDESINEAKMMFGDRFLRVDPEYPNQIALDNVEDIELIKEIAEGYDLDSVCQWMRENWE